MVRHRSRYIAAESTVSDSFASLLKDAATYDLAIFSSSWDNRSVLLSEVPNVRIGTAVVLSFLVADPLGYHDRNDEVVSKFAKAVSRKIVSIRGDSVKVDDLWPELWGAVSECFHSVGRPLRVLIDLSTCPRIYSLGVFAGCMLRGMASSVDIVYAEAEYVPDSHRQGPLSYAFSIGQWNTRPIPFLHGAISPASRKFFLVSIGFQGDKTLRVLSREDPDRISLLVPDPGSKPDYASVTLERNRKIVQHFKIPDLQIVRAACGDAVAAWARLEDASVERQMDEDTYYLCCGTKAHSLALALRALSLEFPTVLYNLPERYNFVGIVPTNVCWKYSIVDLSSVPVSM